MSASPEVSDTVDVVKTEFRWKVKQLSSKMSLGVGTALLSPPFQSSLPNHKKIQWYLELYPGGKEEESKDYISLYLLCCSESTVTVIYSLAVLNENTKKVYRHELDEDLFDKKGEGWGYPRFIARDIINQDINTFTDDTLTISCEISVPRLHKLRHYDNETLTVNTYYEELLKNEKFSDVTMIVGHKQILLHKCILSSISPVFQAMFAHDMKENNENKVKITDIKYKIAMEMFHYIYCRKVNDIKAIAEDLFKAADKYSIAGLKQLCEESILEILSIDNVLKYLPLVTTYEATRLEPKVIEFIVKHLNKVIEMPEYKQLSRGCMDVIIRAVASKEKK